MEEITPKETTNWLGMLIGLLTLIAFVFLEIFIFYSGSWYSKANNQCIVSPIGK